MIYIIVYKNGSIKRFVLSIIVILETTPTVLFYTVMIISHGMR